MIAPLPIPNPCINICRMDLARQYCQGCRRTLEEIGAWDRMSDPERAQVLASLPARVANRGAPA